MAGSSSTCGPTPSPGSSSGKTVGEASGSRAFATQASASQAFESVAFANRVVVVTGGARGIGDAIVRAFGEQGARAVVLDLLPPAEARSGTRYLSVDVSDPAAVKEAAAEIGATEGRIDVLVNNAGIQRVGPTDELPVETWRAVLDTNLSGAFVCAAAVIPIMRGQGSGSDRKSTRLNS